METENSEETRYPHPTARGFFVPGFWPGGRRIQDRQRKEVRL